MNNGICHAPTAIIGKAGGSGDARQDVEGASEVAGGDGEGGGKGSVVDVGRPEARSALESLACVNLCVKDFQILGWDSGLRVTVPFLELAQSPQVTPINEAAYRKRLVEMIGCGGKI
jgi:hypothetical protein